MEDADILYVHSVYLRPFVTFCGQLVYFMVIWYIFSRFGILYQEKSGNPGFNLSETSLELACTWLEDLSDSWMYLSFPASSLANCCRNFFSR
jgi:hypothetical protein